MIYQILFVDLFKIENTKITVNMKKKINAEVMKNIKIKIKVKIKIRI